MKAVTTSRSVSPFPSFVELLSEAWQTLSGKVLPLFGLTFGAGLLNLIILGVGVVSTIVLTGLSLDLSQFRTEQTDPAKAAELMEMVIKSAPTLAGGLLLIAVITGVINIIVQIVMLKYLGEKKTQPMGQLFTQSLPLIVPYFILNLVVGVLILGNLMLLLAPGIIVMFALAFSVYELVLYGGGVVDALKRSVKVVSSHAGNIIGNILLLVLAYALVVIFIPNILLKIEPATGLLVQFVRMVANILLTWLQVTFSLALYAHARKRTNLKESGSLTLIIIGALIGFIIMGMVGAVMVKALKKLNIPELLKGEMASQQTAESGLDIAPSSCGVAIPLPSSTDEFIGEKRRWIYEEVSMTPSSFALLDTDIQPRKFTMASIVGYRAKPYAANTPQFDLNFPAVMVKCIDNPKHYTLDEFVTLVKANKKYEVTVGDRGRLGEVETANVEFTQRNNAAAGSEHGFIAVSKDGNRLIYISMWGGSQNDPALDQSQADMKTISSNMKYRDVSGVLVEPVRTTAK